MKINVKHILSLLCFSLILVLILSFVYHALSWKDTQGVPDFNTPSVIKQLQSTDNELIDVVFVGTSHVYCDILPQTLWSDYGIAAFDMSISSQDRPTAYHCVEEILKTQSPKIICMDLHSMLIEKQPNCESEYRNHLALPLSINELNLLSDYYEDEDYTDLILRWPIVHTRYKELQKWDYLSEPINNFCRGEYISFYNVPMEPKTLPQTALDATISPEEKEWIDSLYNLSQNKNFCLILSVLPYNVNEEDIPKLDAALAYAHTLGIPTIDFNRISGFDVLDYQTDFMDGEHLNSIGADKITKFFAENILQNYSLPDHRGDSSYKLWDEDLIYYNKAKLLNMMENTDNEESYLSLLSALPETVSIISLEYPVGYDMNNPLYKGLSKIGMTENDFAEGGKWIYREGTITKIMNNDPTTPIYVYDLNKHDTLSVRFMDHGSEQNIHINTENYSHEGYRCAILIYDEQLERVATFDRF